MDEEQLPRSFCRPAWLIDIPKEFVAETKLDALTNRFVKKEYGSAQFSDESPISWICFVGALPSGR
jgi:hypothetical protein